MDIKKKRIVFLLDENQLINKPLATVTILTRHILFAIMRLLAYFRNSSSKNTRRKFDAEKNNTVDVLWGYKFYNSRQPKFEYRVHDFYELTVESYESLEKQLSNYFRVDGTVDVTKQKTYSLSSNKSENKSMYFASLNTALSELITDFQWDRPDLMSPDKRIFNCRNDTDTSNEHSVINYIFHISPCPWCLEQLAEHVDELEVKGVKELELSIIPKEFRRIPNVSLYWIDSCDIGQNLTNEVQTGHKLMADLLFMYSGSLFSLFSLSSWWLSTSFKTNKFSGLKDRDSLSLLPSTSLVEVFLQPGSSLKTRLLSDLQETLISRGYSGSENWAIPVFILRGLIVPQGTENVCIHCNDFVDIRQISAIGSVKQCQTFHMMSEDVKIYYCTPKQTSGAGHERDSYLQFLELLNNLSESNSNLVANVYIGENSELQWIAIIQPWTEYCCLICMTTKTRAEETGILKYTVPLQMQDNKNNNDNKMEGQKETLDDVCKNSTEMDGALQSIPFQSSVMLGLEPWFRHMPILGIPTEVLPNSSRHDQEKALLVNNQEYKRTMLLGKIKDEYRKRRPTGGFQDNSANTTSSRGLRMVKLSHEKHSKQGQADASLENTSQGDVNTDLETEENSNDNFAFDVSPITMAKNCEELINAVRETNRQIADEKPDHFSKIAEVLIGAIISVVMETDATNATNTPYAFLREHVLMTVKEVKEIEIADVDGLVSRHVLQTFLWLETAQQVRTEVVNADVENEIVKMLRSASFLQNPEFIVNLLNCTLYPRYSLVLPQVLRGIYDGLMLEPPVALRSPSQDTSDSDSPAPSVESQPSIPTIDQASVSSQPSDRRLFRRLSSIGDASGKRREIVVHSKTEKKLKTRKLTLSSKAMPDRVLMSPPRNRVRRDLFDTREDDGFLKTPEKSKPSTETVLKVKNTPLHKQTRKLVWKLQQRERRRSQVAMERTVVKESPLKDGNDWPPISNFQKSKSFSCRTSPRKFYRIKRLPSCIASASTQKNPTEDFHANLDESSRLIPRSLSLKDGGLGSFNVSNSPFKIQDIRSHDSGTYSSSSTCVAEKDTKTSFSSADSIQNEPKRRLDFLTCERSLPSDVSHPSMLTQSSLFNEDSMDWIAMVEEDRKNMKNEKHRCENESRSQANLGDVDDSTLNVRPTSTQPVATCLTPTQSPHIRDMCIPSPHLSASSLEILEHAPILSPELHGRRKTVSGRVYTSSRKTKRKRELPESPIPLEE